MMNSKWAIAAAAAALVVVIGVSSALALGSPRVNNLTFSGTVALPGTRLAPGTYRFEILDHAGPATVVRVSDEAGQHVFLGMTRLVRRPRSLDANQIVTFEEAPRGTPPPIAVWYPVGTSHGHQFLYPGR